MDTAFRAKQYHYFIVSSTWHNNASVFEPTGKIVSQVKWDMRDDKVKKGNLNPPGNNILVQELDLSYAIAPYSRALKRGTALTDAYGDRVGYRYYQDEECGIFWSNDPQTTIHTMLDKLGLDEIQEEYRRAAESYHKAGVTGY